jgi:hypothetical protein
MLCFSAFLLCNMDRVCNLNCSLAHSLLCQWFLLFLKSISFVSIGSQCRSQAILDMVCLPQFSHSFASPLHLLKSPGMLAPVKRDEADVWWELLKEWTLLHNGLV